MATRKAQVAQVAMVSPPPLDRDDAHAHWAVPALARLLLAPPPSSGVVGDEDYYRPPPLRLPERRMPDPPRDMEDKAAVERWLRHCTALRMYGSGN
jgi:hypothetical protein